jgi:spermidine synthase
MGIQWVNHKWKHYVCKITNSWKYIMEQKGNWVRNSVLACFFISGISGLIYEVIWTRMLGLVFGNTTFATSTVLTAYMSGLALGSYLSARYVDRLKNPLKTYAILEIGIGIYCLILPFIIKLLGEIYLPIQRNYNPSFYSISLIRFALCFIVLLIPTTLMGATLPVFSRFYVRQDEHFGHGVGMVYSINTFGAFAGVMLSGFLMIAYLGVKNTIWIAFAGNIVSASVCMIINQKYFANPSEGKKRNKTIKKVQIDREKAEFRQDNILTNQHRIIFIALMLGFGLSGFSAMVYEVAWTRVLVMIIGSSTYAFSIMLATFLLGIAIGSFIFSLVSKYKSINILWFAITELLIGVIALLMIPVFQKMPFYFVDLFDRFVKNYAILELVKFTVCALMMIIPTILLGSLFPMVTQICAKDYKELGKRVGTIYSINTLGNIGGSFMAGFALIPLIGIQKSIMLAGLINIIVSCIAIIIAERPKIIYRTITSFVFLSIGIVCVISLPSWNEMIISSGAAVYAPTYAKLKGEDRKINILGKAEKLLYYKEGTDSTISVRERQNGTIVMAVDGKIDASNTGDMYTQLLLGHLPLLISSEPKSAMIIGLGSGVTLSAVAQHEVKNIDCVEIEPAVIEASKFFKDVNRNVLDDPRVNMIVNDGRNFLSATSQRYDVIISEPSNIWLAGIANLFSSDFYRICKQHLNPDGYMCQWSHIYYMSIDDIKTVIGTFRSAFPHTTVWFSTVGDILMIGSLKEFNIDYLQLAKNYNIRPVWEDMQKLNILEPLALLSCYLMDEDGVTRFTAGAKINSDNHPILEFSVPKSIYTDMSPSNRKLMSSFKTGEFPKMTNFDEARVTSRASFWYHLGVAYYYKDMPIEAQKYHKKAIEIDESFVPSYIGLALCLLKEKNLDMAMANLKKAISIDPFSAEAHYNLGQIYEDQKMIDDAKLHYESALKYDPRNQAKYQKRLSDLQR